MAMLSDGLSSIDLCNSSTASPAKIATVIQSKGVSIALAASYTINLIALNPLSEEFHRCQYISVTERAAPFF